MNEHTFLYFMYGYCVGTFITVVLVNIFRYIDWKKNNS